MRVIRKGDQLRIRDEWQDRGDNEFIWIAVEDEDGGRVKIAVLGTGLVFTPTQVVRTDMVEILEDGTF